MREDATREGWAGIEAARALSWRRRERSRGRKRTQKATRREGDPGVASAIAVLSPGHSPAVRVQPGPKTASARTRSGRCCKCALTCPSLPLPVCPARPLRSPQSSQPPHDLLSRMSSARVLCPQYKTRVGGGESPDARAFSSLFFFIRFSLALPRIVGLKVGAVRRRRASSPAAVGAASAVV